VLQLRLQELLSLPLDPGSRVHLWKLALERLPGEALAQRRNLQLVLSRQAAKACETWVKAGRWTDALSCALQHGQWLADLARENPPLAEVCRRDTAILLRYLIQDLHVAQEQPNCPLLHQAELCRYGWRLVEKLRALSQPEAEALPVIEEQFVRIGSLAWRELASTLEGNERIAALDNGLDMALALMGLFAHEEGHVWIEKLPVELLQARRQLDLVPPGRLLNWLESWLPHNPAADAALASARRCQALLRGIKRSGEPAEIDGSPAANYSNLEAGTGGTAAQNEPAPLAVAPLGATASSANLSPQAPAEAPSPAESGQQLGSTPSPRAMVSGEELRQELRLDEGGIEGLRRRLARALKRWSDRPGQGPLAIDLGFRPGASLLEGDDGGLQLNLAPLLRCGDEAEVVELLQLLDNHLETLGRQPSWRATPEILLTSLRSHWAAGGQLHASQCRALAAVVKLRGPARVERPVQAGSQLLRPAP